MSVSIPSSKGRLWVITELYYPEETSTGHHMTKIAEGLSSDFEVNVLCGQPNYSKRGTRAKRSEIRNGVRIRRIPGSRLNKNVIIFRMINMLTFGLPILLSSIFRFRSGDKALVVTTPPNLPFAVAVGSLLRGSTYTLLIHDSYPAALVAAGKSSPASLFVRMWHLCNRWLFKHASKIIVLGRDMKALTEKEADGLDVPIVYIPNWAELDLVRPLPRSENRLLNELGITDKFVLLYAGNMGYTNDLEGLIYCASRLQDLPDVHFVFLGEGSKKGELSERVKAENLKNVSILNPRPRSEQPDFLNACDVAVVTLVEGMFGVSVPSRIYNALAAGKPILGVTEVGSELHRIIEEEGIGWSVTPGMNDELLKTIRDIFDNRSAIPQMATRARSVAEQKYSLASSIAKYRRVFTRGRADAAMTFADSHPSELV